MQRKGRNFGWKVIHLLLWVLPLLWVLIGGWFYLHALWHDAEDALPAALSQWLEEEFDVETAISKIQIRGRTLKASDIFVQRRGRPLLRVANVQAQLPLRREPPIQLEATQPEIWLERDQAGRWNFEFLFPKEKVPRRVTINLQMNLKDGVVHFQDAFPQKGKQIVQATARDCNANLHLQDELLTLEGQGVSEVGGSIRARLLQKGSQYSLDGSASRLSWQFIRPYLPKLPLDFRGAGAAVQFHLIAPERQPLQYVGQGNLVAAALQIQRNPIALRSLQGQFTFSNRGFRFSGTAHNPGGQTRVDGLLQYLDRKPEPDWAFYIEGTSSGSSFQTVWRALAGNEPPLAGAYTLRMRGWGTFQQPTFSGWGQVERARLSEFTFRQVNSPFLFTQNTLWLSNVQATLHNSPVYARVRYQIGSEPPTFQLYAEAPHLSLAQLPQARKQDLQGSVSLSLIAQGTLVRPKATLNVSAEALKYRQTALGNLRARVLYEGKTWKVPTANLVGPVGYLQGTGEYRDGRMDFTLEGNELDLAQILGFGIQGSGVRFESTLLTVPRTLSPEARSPNPEIDGIAYVRGRLRGTPEKPQFSGLLEVFDGRVGRVQAEIAVFRLDANPKEVELSSIRIYRRSAWLSGAGRIYNLKGMESQMDLWGQIKDVDLADLATWFESPVKLSGFLQGELQVGGTFKQPRLTGVVQTTRAVVDQVPIEEAHLRLQYEPEKGIGVRSEAVKLAGGNLALEGVFRPDRTLDFRFTGDQLALHVLAPYLPSDIHLEGIARISGTLTGDLDKPGASIDLQAEDLNFNRIALGRLQARLRGEDNVWQADNLTLEAPKGTVVAQSLRYHLQDHTLEGQGSLQAIPVDLVKQIVQERAQNLDPSVWERLADLQGEIDATWNLTGSSKEPQIALNGSVTAIAWRNENLGELKFQGAWDTKAVQIESAEWNVGEARLRAQGWVEPEGDLELDAEMYGFPLQWVRLWEPALPEWSGRVDLSLLASGKTESPEMRLSLTANNVVRDRYPIDRIVMSELRVQEGAIQTEDALLYREGYVAYVSGRLPFHWSPVGVPREEPVELTLRVREQPLAILSLFAPVDTARTKGSLNASLEIRGTLNSPEPSGALEIAQGTLAWKDFSTLLNDLNMRVSFERGYALLQQASARSSAGGSIRLENAQLNVRDYPEGEVGAKVIFEQFRIDEPKLGDLTGPARGGIGGNLQVSGPLKEALIEGDLEMHDSTLSLPEEWQAHPAAKPFAINPRFDIRVAVAPTTELRSPRLRANLEGALEVSGSLQHPNLYGIFSMARGVMNLPTARLRIEPESTIQLSYPVQTPFGETTARLNLNVRATTSVTAIDFTGDPRRYRVELDIRGPLDDPNRLQMEARSDPPYLSERQILALLGRGSAIEALARGRPPEEVLREQLADIFTGQVIPSLLEPLETGIATAFALEQFVLEYDHFADAPVNLFLAKNLFDGFGISYRRSLAGPKGQFQVRLFYRLPLRYRLLQRIKIGWGFDNQPTHFFFLEGSVLFK